MTVNDISNGVVNLKNTKHGQKSLGIQERGDKMSRKERRFMGHPKLFPLVHEIVAKKYVTV